MNGHLQLGISLKDHQQIKDAIKLLESLLPSKLPDHPVEFYNVTPATEGDMVRLSTTKPKMLPNDKIIENLMRGAPKQPKPMSNYKEVKKDVARIKSENLLNELHKPILNTPNWKKIDADIKANKLKEKFRRNALKRKRDIHGHFLKEVKKK